ncbi:MAG: tetratricopeptide repeat protein, partial [Bauldia sp.]|nr:tetratricopeptide repeat protein [Bauldia sp.]
MLAQLIHQTARMPTALLIAGLTVAAGCQTSPTAFTSADIDPATGSAVNIGSLSTVISQNPQDANGYNVRGTAYGKAGKLREAVADFDTAIKLNPNFYQAYANRALVERRLGQDDKALAD